MTALYPENTVGQLAQAGQYLPIVRQISAAEAEFLSLLATTDDAPA